MRNQHIMGRRIVLAAGAALLSLWAGSVLAQGAKPGKPEVTIGADIKQLRFDWAAVPRAGFYQLLRRQADRPDFQPVGPRLTASTTTTSLAVPAHLLDWSGVRYAVAACNTSGCRTSEPIVVQDQMLQAIGYIKGSVTDENQQLGMHMVLSANGRTLAAMRQAPLPENACCVREVMIFRRVAGEWRQEAAVRALDGSDFGDTLAISDDGLNLLVGAPFEPPYEESDDAFWTAGSVYVFTRADGQWTMNTRLRLPDTTAPSQLGTRIGISGDGTKVFAQALRTGQIHFFDRAADGWNHAEALDSPEPDAYCRSFALSGNAQLLVADCDSPTNGRRSHILAREAGQWSIVQSVPLSRYAFFKPSPLSIDYTGDTIAVVDAVESDYKVAVLKRSGGTWLRETELMSFFRTPQPAPVASSYGDMVRLSADGATLAVNDWADATLGSGVLQVPGADGAPNSGSVYVYRRADSGWQLRSFVKAPNAEADDSFGWAIGISHNGRTLAVSAFGESSAATGTSGDQSNNDAPYAGALYLY